MKKITVFFQNNKINELAITDKNISIGRRPDNDIPLDNPIVSGKHATIHVMGGDCIYEDLGSTNGSFIGSKQIKKHILQNNDSILIGEFKITYEEIEIAAVSNFHDDFEKTMIIRPKAMPSSQQPKPQNTTTPPRPTTVPLSAPPQKPIQPVVKPQPVNVAQMQPTIKPETLTATPAGPVSSDKTGNIQLLNGQGAGKCLALVKPMTTIGKPGVQTASILKRADGYFIIKAEGSHEILVNEADIGNGSHKLENHDVIDFVGVKLEFFYN